MDAGRQADWPDPLARGVRQSLLRRAKAQPPVHGCEPVALRRIYRHARRRTGLTRSAVARRGEGGVGAAGAPLKKKAATRAAFFLVSVSKGPTGRDVAGRPDP